MCAKSCNLTTSASKEGEFLHELEEKMEVGTTIGLDVKLQNWALFHSDTISYPSCIVSIWVPIPAVYYYYGHDEVVGVHGIHNFLEVPSSRKLSNDVSTLLHMWLSLNMHFN